MTRKFTSAGLAAFMLPPTDLLDSTGTARPTHYGSPLGPGASSRGLAVCNTCGGPYRAYVGGRPSGCRHEPDCAAHAQELALAEHKRHLAENIQDLVTFTRGALADLHTLRDDLRLVRNERDALRKNVDDLAAARESIAMLVPVGESTGTVEQNIAEYVAHLKAQRDAATQAHESTDRLRSVVEALAQALCDCRDEEFDESDPLAEFCVRVLEVDPRGPCPWCAAGMALQRLLTET